MITDRQIQAFHRDGAVMIKGAMTDWVDVMRAGVARNMEHPSKYASENDVPEGQGR
ncbi:MAG: phytanoyl-CoA dioxygenase, partial [Gammaproteobacteria bacterium]|nr:phytanoyl-CoA dioxygenase [Gammaproteobacteria bacterium]